MLKSLKSKFKSKADPNTRTIRIPAIEVTVPTKVGIMNAVEPVLSDSRERVGEAANRASEVAGTLAHDAGEWVKPRIEQGREAISHLQEQKQENAQKASEDMQKAKKQAAKEATKAASKKAAKKKKEDGKGGGFFSTLLMVAAVLATAGVVAWYLNKRQMEQDDPWARPLTDPYAAPTSGRDSSVEESAVSGTAPGQVITTEEAAKIAKTDEADGVVPSSPDSSEKAADSLPETPETPENSPENKGNL